MATLKHRQTRNNDMNVHRVEESKTLSPSCFMDFPNCGTHVGHLDPMEATVPHLRKIGILAGCGHWTQQERPAEVNAAIRDFLRHESWR